jgi:hypothetical protein
MTARELIDGSLRLLGVLASGETASNNEANDALEALNDLLDLWSTQRLIIPNSVRETFPLVSGQQTYQMGTLGDFATSRPQKIEQALVQDPSQSPVLELPMTILNQAEYAAIALKATTSTYPLYLFNDDAFPRTSINVWPVPSASGYNIVLYSWKPLGGIANLTDELQLPPGYYLTLKYNLALHLAPEFGKPIPEIVASIAQSSKGDIKRMNTKPAYLQADEALVGRGGTWNWLTGGTT